LPIEELTGHHENAIYEESQAHNDFHAVLVIRIFVAVMHLPSTTVS
jgi:hypothetical protein